MFTDISIFLSHIPTKVAVSYPSDTANIPTPILTDIFLDKLVHMIIIKNNKYVNATKDITHNIKITYNISTLVSSCI